MKEINAIIDAYETRKDQGERTALATVVRVDGSSYRRTGARMFVSENGQWVGGISGGCLEGDALRRAKMAIMQDKPSVVTYDTTEDDAHQIGVGLGCNGIIDILITPITDDDTDHPIHELERAREERRPQVLVTVVESEHDDLPQGKVVLYKDDDAFASQLHGDILDAVHQAFAKKKSKLTELTIDSQAVTCFVEFLPPPIHLIVQGGNYDIYPLLRQAHELGWRLTVVANPKKLDRVAFDLATDIISSKSEELPFIDEYTATILMAHDYATDLRHLKALLETDIPYIGLLGPRKRTLKMYADLNKADRSLTVADEKRIHSPVGLDIGAASPEEIALSILAEIVTFFSGRAGGHLKHREGPIHER